MFSLQLVDFRLLSFVYIECAGYLYTNCDVKWQPLDGMQTDNGN